MTIRLAAILSIAALAPFPAPAQVAPAQAASAQDWIDFGDNSGQWALDDDCDDPRFEGPGMNASVLDDHRFHDAADCRAAFDAKTVTMRHDIINFGVDGGRMARDGVCDDLRFEGESMRSMLFGDHVGMDGADCRAAWDAGDVALRTDAIIFGADSGAFANDGVCDDPRFRGPGLAPELSADAPEGRDAADCRQAFLAGQIEIAARDGLYGLNVAAAYDGVDFGDNSSVRAQDGVCDDPRFAGAGVAPEPAPGDAKRDAADCAAAWLAGGLALK